MADNALLSLDVFDTVLTRTTGSPAATLLLFGRTLHRQGMISCAGEKFARVRLEAERDAYQEVGSRTTLHDIYRLIGARLQLTASAREQLMVLEQAFEARVLRPVPLMTARLRRWRAEGKRIAFVSDMYLSSRFVKERLVEHGLFEEGDVCYVSCEAGQSKRNGLFTSVLCAERVRPHEVTHVGNQRNEDMVAPKRLGIRVEPYIAANFNRHEQLLDREGWVTEGVSSAMAAASRMTRLSIHVDKAREEAIRDVAAGVVAPTLIGYVLWVLEMARQHNINRLYFVSRDGQVLHELAQRLIKKLQQPVELRYLFGSRQAWNLAAASDVSAQQLLWMWDATDVLSVRSLLARAHLQPEHVRATLYRFGFDERNWNRNLLSSERRRLRALFKDEAFRAAVLERIAQQRRLTLRYFRQEGLCDGRPSVLVDMGWTGSLQNAAGELVREAGGCLTGGLYFGIRHDARRNHFGFRHAYLFDESHGGLTAAMRMKLIRVLELFTAADHGTVMGYEETGAGIRPQLREAHNQQALDWGLPLVRQVVLRVADELMLDETLVNPQADLRRVTEQLLSRFWLEPTRTEAEAWGACPWEDGLGALSYSMAFARRYRWRDSAKAWLAGELPSHHRGAWPHGSLVLTPQPLRLAVRLATVLSLRKPHD
ncbi:MAG: hypothetical protein HY352_05150 [Candidatus Omnitrophica bacterium]|nr:hypothetical protein [Candidatus Omnitrophota bacterium]